MHAPDHPPPSWRRRALLRVGLAAAIGAPPGLQTSAHAARLLQVGPTRHIRSVAEAARLATDGSTIEVDAGEYLADVAVWKADGITLKAVGGRARMIAQGAAAEGKGIWVIRSKQMSVQGFDFEGARVPSRNGAGIRLETGRLQVKDCRFWHNEMGLLTNHDPACELDVTQCEFSHNRRPDGHNHNLYVGRIARLSVTASYLHHASIGHLLKSRAAENHIRYNRLTDEAGGNASYELEFPNGGLAHVVGNIIAQGKGTDNIHLISYGAESYRWPRNEIHLVHNTLVNPLDEKGQFLRVARGADKILSINNLLIGAGRLETAGTGEFAGNLSADERDFADAGAHDYRLLASSRLVGRAAALAASIAPDLRPRREYAHPAGDRPLAGAAHNPGAMQSTA